MSAGVINPGAGRYDGSNQKRQAERNVRRLIREAGIAAAVRLDRETPDATGHYWFTVRLGKRTVPVCVPGCRRAPLSGSLAQPGRSRSGATSTATHGHGSLRPESCASLCAVAAPAGEAAWMPARTAHSNRCLPLDLVPVRRTPTVRGCDKSRASYSSPSQP